jgi:hypothetical protein
MYDLGKDKDIICLLYIKTFVKKCRFRKLRIITVIVKMYLILYVFNVLYLKLNFSVEVFSTKALKCSNILLHVQSVFVSVLVTFGQKRYIVA